MNKHTPVKIPANFYKYLKLIRPKRWCFISPIPLAAALDLPCSKFRHTSGVELIDSHKSSNIESSVYSPLSKTPLTFIDGIMSVWKISSFPMLFNTSLSCKGFSSLKILLAQSTILL